MSDVMNKPRALQHVCPDWFVCGVCNRSQAFAPQDKSGGVTVEEAEVLGWRRTTDEEWLCPLHSGTEKAAIYEHKQHEHLTPGTATLVLAIMAVSFAALTFRAAAFAWCWNHLAPHLWAGAPRVQAWAVFGLLVLQPALRIRPEDGESELGLSERLRLQRGRLVGSVVETALSWGVVWLLLQVFGR